MAEIGTIIDGKYEILTEIGRGGMSIVYLAMDTHLNKQWAVKEIRKRGSGKNDEIVVNSLLAEANLMKRLDHPSLPRIVDIIDNGVTIFVVMDYIEGESLDKILDEYGVQPEELVINWAKQLCDALSYLHSQKPPIIYRDMKPANVMLKPEGNIKIIDFGIAREYKELSLADTTVLGTKGYAPPEQYSGQTDARSDIFALGMTMHHLLTGVDPRSGEAYAPVRMWNPDLSEGIEIIIDKCVQPAPENRYQSCDELLFDLEHPELITKDYRNKQKKKFNTFLTTAIITVAMVVIGSGSAVAANVINSNDYNNLISSSSTMAIDNRIDNYKKAIEIYPERIEAYQNMLTAFEDEGRIRKKDNDVFISIYDQNKNSFDISSQEYAALNYKAGMLYLNYYTDNTGEPCSFSERIQKAYPFFEINFSNKNISPQFEQKNVSDCYYQICSFYKRFILDNASVEEASKAEYDKLFSTMDQAMKDIQNASPYDQLYLCNSIFMLLYDQREQMCQVGVSESTVTGLMDQVYSKAKALSFQKKQTQKLQAEILDNYSGYKADIQRTYSNAARNASLGR